MEKYCYLIDMKTNVCTLDSAVDKVINLVKNKSGAYVCISNVHMCMEVYDSKNFRAAVNDADLIVPDGRPLFFAQKLLGYSQAEQVRGQDLMNALCSISSTENISIGLYGGFDEEVLDSVKTALKRMFPHINIVYSFSPPFRKLSNSEDVEIISNISSSGVDVLFVGIGCPKQEYWMAEHKNKLNCVMLGVGAAFDFISGNKKHAPRWMQKVGLEWLFRLLSEPKRLWKRYLKQNPRFIYYFLQQWLLKKDFTKEGPENV